MERKVLYIDSNESDRDKFAKEFEKQENLVLETVGSVEEALSVLDSVKVKCLVTEADFPEGRLEDILKKAGDQEGSPVPLLFTSKDFDDVPTDQMIKFSAYVSKTSENAYEKIVSEIDSLLESRSELDYPLPENEEERLEYLEKVDIEDLAESNDFQRLAKIGTELFDTKWCFVGLVAEDRERFLSFEGSKTEELDRSCTICTFAINQDDVMVVEDRNKDPRFKYVDELEEIGINWYAGAPLKTEEGYHIGSFCVADTEKKQFSEKERKLLELFAEEATQKVVLKQKASETIIDKLKNKIL